MQNVHYGNPLPALPVTVTRGYLGCIKNKAMITIRKSEERGHANHGWLDSHHTFSFADYHDPQHIHFRSLRVINEDHVAAGAGFPIHPHRDMEIVTYVVSGAVAHRDSTGGQGVIKPGQLQHMSAGTGVQHSEFNASKTEPLHLLQIWILPEKNGLTPSYSETALNGAPQSEPLRLVGSREGGDGALKIKQDVRLFVGKMKADETVEYTLAPDRHAWVQLISGALRVNDRDLRSGDAAAVSGESLLKLSATEPSHFLLFDLA
jgi:redox-sensitive bicupin YhaK (pirin superfamily)